MLSDENLFKPRLLHQLLSQRANDVCGVAAVSTKSRFSKSRWSTFRRKVRFWGIGGLLILGTQSLIKKLMYRLPLPEYLLMYSSVQHVCQLFEIPYEKVFDIADRDFILLAELVQAVETVRVGVGAESLDAVVSNEFGQIVGTVDAHFASGDACFTSYD